MVVALFVVLFVFGVRLVVFFVDVFCVVVEVIVVNGDVFGFVEAGVVVVMTGAKLTVVVGDGVVVESAFIIEGVKTLPIVVTIDGTKSIGLVHG